MDHSTVSTLVVRVISRPTYFKATGPYLWSLKRFSTQRMYLDVILFPLYQEKLNKCNEHSTNCAKLIAKLVFSLMSHNTGVTQKRNCAKQNTQKNLLSEKK